MSEVIFAACPLCGECMDFVRHGTVRCINKDKGDHEHLYCPRCTPDGAGFCLIRPAAKAQRCEEYSDAFGHCVKRAGHAGEHVGRVPGFSGPDPSTVPDYYEEEADHDSSASRLDVK